ncbi:MAG TPA: hypothetical protein VG777_07510 [Thermoanaerobaculia bacterium]|nr:hypothetical protein [Thermoanaerobaculia bacterium]
MKEETMRSRRRIWITALFAAAAAAAIAIAGSALWRFLLELHGIHR